MTDARIEAWLTRLSSPDSSERVSAARSLSERDDLPAHAASALVKTLSDDASVSEEHSDWDGTVLGGATYFARDYAATSLKKLGEPAIVALLAQPGHESLLVEVVVQAGPDRLAKMSSELRDRVRQKLQGHWSAERAGWALEWAEAAPGDEAIVRAHPELRAVVEACERLAQKPDAKRAHVVLERFADEEIPSEYEERLTKAMQILAPLAGDAELTRFVERVAARAGWRVLSIVSSLGPRVAGAGRALLDRLMAELKGSRSHELGSVARAVGLVVGAPTSADDQRVRHFLTVIGKVRGAMVPPSEVLDALVLACAGEANLAPWVVPPLIAQLGEKEFERRVDASLRLRALRTHAEPAVSALEAALREEASGPRASWSGTSELAWTLSLAGPAAAKAVPLFIELLENPKTARIGLHALNGQSELFGAAVPALEAHLGRVTDKWERADVERTLTRVRHLSSQVKR